MTEQSRRAARLIQIERLLRRRPGGLKVLELAQELGYSPRTIQRDLAVLESELGVPLITSGRRYRIMPGSHPLTPVRLTLQEARAIYLATRLFLRYADERDPDGISALEKLAESLPEPIARQVAATSRQLMQRPTRREYSDVLRKLTEAWASGRTVFLRYRSHQARAVRETRLDPYLLEPSATGAATYVVGFSHEHGEVRTFKLDRIQHAEFTSQSFDVPDVTDIVEQMANSWGGVVLSEEDYDIVVDFSSAVADRVAETHWHPSQRLTPLDEGGVRLELRLPSLLEFVPWVRSWGHDAVVVEPGELREQVADSLRAAAALYGQSA